MYAFETPFAADHARTATSRGPTDAHHRGAHVRAPLLAAAGSGLCISLLGSCLDQLNPFRHARLQGLRRGDEGALPSRVVRVSQHA